MDDTATHTLATLARRLEFELGGQQRTLSKTFASGRQIWLDDTLRLPRAFPWAASSRAQAEALAALWSGRIGRLARRLLLSEASIEAMLRS